MSDWNLRNDWKELRDAIHDLVSGASDGDDDEQAEDAGLLSHLLFSAPLVIAVLVLARRMSGA